MGEPMGPNNDMATKIVQELTAERDRLCEEVNRLRTEAAELRRALEEAQRDKAAIVAERDCYLQALEEFMADMVADMDKNGLDFGDVVAEIEQDFRARGLLDGK